jgi:hypothetical protein
VEIPGGDWADLAPALNHAQYRRIRAAVGDARIDEGVAAMLTSWALRDTDGNAIPFPERTVEGIPTSALASIPLNTFVIIAEAASDLLQRELVPKDAGETSPGSSQGPPSQSISSSPTPTSSTDIPDGPTGISQLRRPA